jgi:hypothetical protein
MTEIADLPAAASASAAALAGYYDLDWQPLPAADLEWSCWKTALHMVDCLYFYTCQIVYGNVPVHRACPRRFGLAGAAAGR